MIVMKFDGGPLDGQTIQDPSLDAAPLEHNVPMPIAQLTDIKLPLATCRYVLHFVDAKGVAHYYVPTTRQ